MSINFEKKLMELKQYAIYVRQVILRKYNSTFGRCIEASDNLVDLLNKNGYKAKAIQVWVLYEYFEGCTDICYEEHWFVKVKVGNRNVYVDTTIDQFQWAFSRALPEIYIDAKLPLFYLKSKPSKAILKLCGWTDWYNTGDYVNCFKYYED